MTDFCNLYKIFVKTLIYLDITISKDVSMIIIMTDKNLEVSITKMKAVFKTVFIF